MTIPHKRKAAQLGGNEKSGRKGASEHGTNEELSRRGESEEREMGEAIDIDGLPVPMEKRVRVSTQFSEPARSASHTGMSAKSRSVAWRSTKITDPPHGASHTSSSFFWPYKAPLSQADVKPARSSMQLANNASVTATLRNQFDALLTTLPLPTDCKDLTRVSGQVPMDED